MLIVDLPMFLLILTITCIPHVHHYPSSLTLTPPRLHKYTPDKSTENGMCTSSTKTLPYMLPNETHR
jgi:hypothetical protein